MATVRELKQERLHEVEVSIRVLEKFIRDYRVDLGELQTEQAQLKKHIKRLETEPEITEYVLRVQTDGLEVTDRWIDDVVENLRAYAYPKIWGLEGKGIGKPPVFRVEFEIQASERSGCEYLNDVKGNLLYAGIDSGTSEITEVGAKS